MYCKILGSIVKNIHISASGVQILILSILWSIFVFQIYCENRQYKLLKNTLTPTLKLEGSSNETNSNPNPNSNVVNKINYSSSNFNLEQLQYSMLSSIYAVILSTVEIYFGFYYQYWTMAEKLSPFNNEIVHNCVWFHILYTIYSLCDTPYSVYENSINNPTVDKSNRNSRGRPFFFSGNLISYAFVQILGIFFCTVFIILARDCGNYYVFLSIWLVLILIYLTCYNFYSPLIMKNFNTHVPLPRGKLRTAIEALCKQLAFPLNEIYVIDRTNWFGYKNIEMIGVTKERYIVINEILLPKKRQVDDMLAGYPNLKPETPLNNDGSDENMEKGLLDNEEILAVTAHELGHWYKNHFYKLFTVLVLYYIVMFLLFGLTYQRDIIFLAFGFPENVKPILAGLFSILSYIITPYNMLSNFLINIYSQNLEYEADEFSFRLGYAKKLRSGLIKIYSDKVVFPKMDPFYSKWKLDQPTLPERLKALEGLEKNIKTDMNVLINEHIKKGLECLNNVENMFFDPREPKKGANDKDTKKGFNDSKKGGNDSKKGGNDSKKGVNEAKKGNESKKGVNDAIKGVNDVNAKKDFNEPKKVVSVSIAGSSKDLGNDEEKKFRGLKIKCRQLEFQNKIRELHTAEILNKNKNLSIVPVRYANLIKKNELPPQQSTTVNNSLPAILHKSRLKWPKESCLEKINSKLKKIGYSDVYKIDDVKAKNVKVQVLERPKTCHQICRRNLTTLGTDLLNVSYFEVKRPSTSHSTKSDSRYKYSSLIPIRQTYYNKKFNNSINSINIKNPIISKFENEKCGKNFRFCDDQG